MQICRTVRPTICTRIDTGRARLHRAIGRGEADVTSGRSRWATRRQIADSGASRGAVCAPCSRQLPARDRHLVAMRHFDMWEAWRSRGDLCIGAQTGAVRDLPDELEDVDIRSALASGWDIGTTARAAAGS